MSKEEYANEIKKLAYHYNKGKEDERKRILKLIDEKITLIKSIHKNCLACEGEIIRLEELKKELTKNE